MTSALVLLSGGLDSTTLLTRAVLSSTVSRVEAVFVNYGQRHIRERESSILIAQLLGVKWHQLDLTGFGQSVRSALTSRDVDVPHGHYAAENMSLTVVPGRNAVFLSAAAGLAATLGLDQVQAAVHAGDHPIYPDCRPEFMTALGQALRLGYDVALRTPFVTYTKAQIAFLATEYGAPVALSWSCYEGGERHCGRCGTCVERAEAFHLAGAPDPTDYADRDFWRQAVKVD
jgi:7-cyano-7-deazaguanine synthase